MIQVPRHKVFVTYHHEDQHYKNEFVRLMDYNIVNRSVGDGDIDDVNIKTETIRQRIRDEFIRDATVTVVLVGPCTWQRKHVDWEIGSSLRDTRLNPRCGLLGIILPNHPDAGGPTYHRHLLPPRLADNCEGDAPFAEIRPWSGTDQDVRYWIDVAFERRTRFPHPDNSRPQFQHNRSGSCLDGWR